MSDGSAESERRYTPATSLDTSLRSEDWDRQAVLELIADASVQIEGDHDVAASLIGAAAAPEGRIVWSPRLGDRLHLVCPEDRVGVVSAWRHALENPGAVVTTWFRMHWDGRWLEVRQRFLCLFDNPALPLHIGITDGHRPLPDDLVPHRLEGALPAELARWALLRTGVDGRIETAQGTTEALLGCPPDALVGTVASELVHPDDRLTSVEVLTAVLARPGHAISVEHRLRRPDGEIVWVESTLLADELDELQAQDRGTSSQMSILLIDVEDRRAQRDQLRQAREEATALAEEFRLLAEEIPSGAFRADLAGTIQYANGVFVELAGGRRVTSLLELVHPDDAGVLRAALAELGERADAGDEGTVSVELRAAIGEGVLALRMRATRTPTGAAAGMVGVLADATTTVALRAQARTDALTGLHNRTALDQHIESQLAAGRVVAAVFIDLDEFKAVNDRFGHHAGDEVLRAIGKRLRRGVRPTELVARYGGDEFVVVALDPSHETLESLHARVGELLVDPVHFEDGFWQPRASVGIALSDPGDGPADVLRRADHQMYVAKRQRRGQAAHLGEAPVDGRAARPDHDRRRPDDEPRRSAPTDPTR